MKDKYVLYVIGGHYGDEAKGKITDLLAPKFDVVVRGSGGNNAGHTIIAGKEKIALHLLPAGTLHKHPLSVLGMEMMIDPNSLETELEAVRKWNPKPKLVIARQAHLVMDWHKIFDGNSELGEKKIGTTKRGIGPAAEAKYSRRWAIQIGDLLDPKLSDKIFSVLSEQRLRLISAHPRFHKFAKMKLYDILYTKKRVAFESELRKYAKEQAAIASRIGKRFQKHIIADVGEEISKDRYRTILGEGAQGTMLDPTFGLLPYVTSTPTTSQGISRGMAFEPRSKEVMGVFKAYETRVGEGPFPTQMPTALGRNIQKKGGEFGATTGRARRCGWFNLEEARYAVRVNGLTWMAITKLDVLDELKEIKVGLGIRNGKMVYKSFKGWRKDTTKCRTWSSLPKEAKEYLRYLESNLVPISLVSVGPERTETILLDDFKKHLRKAGVSP